MAEPPGALTHLLGGQVWGDHEPSSLCWSEPHREWQVSVPGGASWVGAAWETFHYDVTHTCPCQGQSSHR